MNGKTFDMDLPTKENVYYFMEMYNDYDYDLTDDCVLCGAKGSVSDR